MWNYFKGNYEQMKKKLDLVWDKILTNSNPNIDTIEKVQKRATKLIPSLKDMDYTKPLKKLKMPTLQYRSLRGDMIEVYKS